MYTNNDILQGYENTKYIHYATAELPNTVPYDELGNRKISGVLKANRYENGRLMQTYTEQENHVAVIAATRQGKSTSYVVPTVLSFAMQQVKRSMLITDPKGEIYRYTAETLRQQGYDVKLLNFRDFTKSECWNPLTGIYRKYMQAKNIADEVKLVRVDGVNKNEFRGRIYDDQTELDYDLETTQTLMFDSVEAEIDNMARMLIDTVCTRDPTWEDGARDFLKGFIFAMLEDTELKVNPITEDTFSLSTIFSIADKFKNTDSGYDDCGYFSNRSKDSKSYGLVKNIILDTANATRSSYMSVFVTKLTEYKEITTRTITSCNSFDLEGLADGGPVAIFIDFRDEIKSPVSDYTHL
ncbi:MAG: type IV secretory system conjugative DNA transfer family protein, partial [Clostridiales bacterium]|nr:type IV secretory system conjugative DNA transfer family protein [Clostridiales bacterium]